MSRLRITLKQYVQGQAPPVAAEILNTRLEILQQLHLTVNEPTVVDIEPGHYLVSAKLPSGRTVRCDAVVDADSAAEVTLRGEPARQEWLSWPHYLGSLGRNPVKLTQRIRETTWVTLWAFADRRWQPVPWPTVPFVGDEYSQATQITFGTGNIHLLQLEGTCVASRFIAVPPTISPVQLLIRGSGENTRLHGGVVVRLATLNAGVEALLRYNAVGAVESANIVGQPIAEREMRLLEGSLASESPLDSVGSIAGVQDVNGSIVVLYYFLRTGAYEKLADWPRRLSESFPWLPDAAVIRAAQLMSKPLNGDQLEEVKELLLRCVGLGLPVYTEGLRYLRAFLRAFTSDEKYSAGAGLRLREAFEYVRRYAAVTDWTQPRTTVYAADIANPLQSGEAQSSVTEYARFLDRVVTGGGSAVLRAPNENRGPSEHELATITSAQLGSRSAFDELYGAYSRRLRGFILSRCFNSADADDIAQQVWKRLWERIGFYDPSRSDFFTFARVYATFSQKQFYRAQKNDSHAMLFKNDLEETPTSDPDELLDWAHASVEHAIIRAEVFDDLLIRALSDDGPPHQLVAFCFSKLLGYTPRAFSQAFSAVPLRELAKRFEYEYVRQIPDREKLIGDALRPLHRKMMRPLGEITRDPVTRLKYSALLDRTAGDTSPADYFTNNAEANISHWSYAVKRRVLSRLRAPAHD